MNNLFKKFGIKECKVKLYRVETHRKESRYNLRSRTNSNPLESVVKIAMSPKLLKTKQIARISHENIIWNELISRDYVLGPGVFVMAKMSKYRPWPARINTIYKVGDIVKCFVLFFGTLQIGSVLKKDCVSFSQCDLYLSSTIGEIKKKYKWVKDYDRIAESSDLQRAQEIAKLTQIQKFLLALREIEKLHKIPLDRSMVKIDTI